MAEIVLTLVVSPVIQEALSRVTSFVATWLHTATGFKRELKKLEDLLKFVHSVIDDAEGKQQSNGAISLWLRDLKLVAEDAVDLLDECDYERLKNEVKTRDRKSKRTIHFSIGSPVTGYRIGDKIKKINKRLSELEKRAGPLVLATKCQCHSTPKQYPKTDSILDSKVFGREDVVEKILRMLVNQKNEPVSGVSIIGMAGLGKTTIARSLYKKAKEEKLYDLAAWVCVSEDFNEHTILSEILEHFKDGASRRDNINVLLEDLAKELEKKTFLLILDDVWNKDPSKWDAFSSLLSKILKTTGNSIVVTTRSGQVASAMKGLPMLDYEIQRLSNGECWSIIEETVLRSSKQTSISSDLEVIGRDIAQQCGGLPLVAKVIGGTLSRQIYADKWLAIKKNNAWNLDSLDRDKILSILKISFDHLRLPLKKCFSYCSIFPKDWVIEKDDLVQLWMAQGFLYQHNDKTMEDIGDEYFNDLLSNSLFQDIERDRFENIISCKMHDVVHDLALFVSKDETLIWEAGCKDDQNANIRHLRVKYVGNELPVLPDDLLQRLHSLFTEDADVFNAMASNLKRLRALKLAGARSHRHRNLAEAEKKELDPALGELKHLRYFDISNKTGYALPKSFCKLYNLQTFRLINYGGLPGDVMTGLVSLRHICFYTFNSYPVPRRIGHLTSLQTLPVISVGEKKGDGIVEELGGLTQLRGELKIMRLGNVRSRLEATQANLKEKAGLCKLELDWAFTSDSSNDEEVLEGLQPHPNLKSLSIIWYKGKSFPPWMMSGGATFMSNNLVELELGNWPNCQHIPSLGLLPGLKSLNINNFKNVKRMGHKFDTIGSNCPGGVKSIKLFPALRQLNLQSMESLEEWVEVNDDDVTAGGKVEIVFPCLEILEIWNCPRLKIWQMGGFSSHHKLSRLGISECDNLMAIPSMNGLSSLQFLRIKKCFNLRSIPEECLYCLTSLKELEMGYFWEELEKFPGLTYIHKLNSSLESLKLHGWDKVKSLPDQLQHLTALKELTLYKFNGVKAFPEGLGNLTSLKQLNLEGFNGVEAFPEGLGNLTSLQQLSISCCGNLKHLFPLQALKSLIVLRMGPFSSDLEEFPRLDCIFHLRASLKKLRLDGWDKIKFLPDQLQHLTALEFLYLRNFQSVEVLPDWLGNLSSLQYLWIYNCPILEERCVKHTGGVKYTGEEWSKISHIPEIRIGGSFIKCGGQLYIKS